MNNNNTIPKIIHQIWYQGENNIPKDYPNYSQTWKKYNPEFEYILWDQEKIENLIKTNFPQFLEKHNSFPQLMQKIDSAKSMILYTHGGVYVDIDSECTKNISDLINKNEIVLAKCDINIFIRMFMYKTTNEIIQAGFMATVKNHPFWKYCVHLMLKEDINKGMFETHEQWIHRITGPGMYTRAFYSFPNTEKFTVLSQDFIDPIQACEYDYYDCDKNNCKINYPNAYAFHHYGSKHETHGWLSGFGKQASKLYCKNQSYIYSIICVCIIILIIFVYLYLKRNNYV